MNLMKKVFIHGLNAVLILSLATPAHAGSIREMEAHRDSVCKKVDEADPTLGAETETLGVAKHECELAKSAIDLAKASEIKAWTFGVLGTTCAALAFSSWLSAGASEKICAFASAAVMASSFLIDKSVKQKLTERVSALETTSTLDGVTTLGRSVHTLWAGGKLGQEILEKHPNLATKLASKKAAKHLGCIVSSALGFFEMGIAIGDRSAADTANDEFVKTANDKLMAFYSGNNVRFNGSDPDKRVSGLNKGVGAPTNAKGESADPCASASGNAYLGCVNQKIQDPQISAILASPEVLGAVEKVMGRPMGDALKEFRSQGGGDVARSVASNMGLGAQGPSMIKSMIAEAQKVAKELGIDQRGGVYLSKGKKPSAPQGETLDFSKMMGNLMNQLNPDQKKNAKEDPAETVFRKLDLLPAEKIEASKDISLFARIGYRYRKKTQAEAEPVKSP